ncbi:hypothetical protein [Polaribacter huanghezhanensis]|nr:hypothetical protein [Polaribacter huanghezhanensis]
MVSEIGNTRITQKETLDDENHSTGAFDAIALALVYFYLEV